MGRAAAQIPRKPRLAAVPDTIDVLRARLDEVAVQEDEAREQWKRQRAEFQRRKDDLRAAIQDMQGGRTRAPRSSASLDPHTQAGHANVTAMLSAFRTMRKMTMAEAAEMSGVRSGTATWAVRALVADGRIAPTGVRRSRSLEYKYVPRRRVR